MTEIRLPGRHVRRRRVQPYERSQSTRRHVAIYLSLLPDEDNAVPRGIAGVPLHLLVGNRNACASRNHALAIGDDGDIVIALDFEAVGLKSVRLSAARYARMVGLLERLEPLADIFRQVRP